MGKGSITAEKFSCLKIVLISLAIARVLQPCTILIFPYKVSFTEFACEMVTPISLAFLRISIVTFMLEMIKGFSYRPTATCFFLQTKNFVYLLFLTAQFFLTLQLPFVTFDWCMLSSKVFFRIFCQFFKIFDLSIYLSACHHGDSLFYRKYCVASVLTLDF